MKNFKDFIIDNICRECHTANNSLRLTNNESELPDWEYLSQDLKDNTKNTVLQILDNPSYTAENAHDEWMKHKMTQGWVYGENKDDVKKTHPLLIPFSEMSDIDKLKDQLFIDIVNKYRNLIASY